MEETVGPDVQRLKPTRSRIEEALDALGEFSARDSGNNGIKNSIRLEDQGLFQRLGTFKMGIFLISLSSS